MKKRIVFDTIPIEIDFLIDIINSWLITYPESRPFFAVRTPEEGKVIAARFPHLIRKGDFIIRDLLPLKANEKNIGLLLTSEQYAAPVPGLINVCCFHGQASKGHTLTTKIDKGYSAYFVLGPLQRKALETHYLEHYGKLPETPILINIGQTNKDRLLAGEWKRNDVLREQGLDPSRPTILYAPAFNEGASLREFGPELVARLEALRDCNILIKLSVDNYASPSDMRRNGGVDWFKTLSIFERHPHIRIFRDIRIDPALAAADVLITDISSVSFDFMILGKPVVFIDVPRFWNETLKQQFPQEDTSGWINRLDKNAGREFGLVAQNLDELLPCVREALAKGSSEAFAEDMQKRLLYHPGKAVPFAVKVLEHLLASLPQERKLVKASPYAKGFRNAGATVAAARAEGLSVNDYLEAHEDTPKKRGHRDRIIAEMQKHKLLELNGKTVLEIGAGTGRFLEKVLEKKPARYEVYETAPDWANYLANEYGHRHPELYIQPADGRSLRDTPTASCDLIHAHAVFVYLNFTTLIGYLEESARVLKSGGVLCCDFLYDTDWNLDVAHEWSRRNLHFPVVLSRSLMEDIFAELNLKPASEFTEIYGGTFSRYVILEKALD